MLLNEFLKEHRRVDQLKSDFESKLADQQRQIEALIAGLQKRERFSFAMFDLTDRALAAVVGALTTGFARLVASESNGFLSASAFAQPRSLMIIGD